MRQSFSLAHPNEGDGCGEELRNESLTKTCFREWYVHVYVYACVCLFVCM